MLSKDICKRCYEVYYHAGNWFETDDESWDNDGIVMYCPVDFYMPISGGPPDGCPYVLEHMMVEQGNDE